MSDKKSALVYGRDEWEFTSGINLGASTIERVESLKRVKEAGLPHCRYESLHILKDSDLEGFVSKAISKFGLPVDVKLFPYITGKKREFCFNLNDQEKILDIIGYGKHPNYQCFISESTSDFEYSGTAISNGKGRIYVEFIDADHKYLSSGDLTPAIVVVLDFEILKASKYMALSDTKKLRNYIEFMRGCFNFLKCNVRGKNDFYFFDYLTKEIYLKDLEKLIFNSGFL